MLDYAPVPSRTKFVLADLDSVPMDLDGLCYLTALTINFLPALLMLVKVSRTIVFRSNAPAVEPCHNIAYSPDT